jgi:endonuclease G
MTPSEDRTATDADNAATFLMTNVLPQAPRANRGPWVQLETDSRTLAQAGNELYIVSGPAGSIGTLASGTIRIPAATWKAVLILPVGDNDASRVTTATRVIAIRIPNNKDDLSVQQSDPWQQYRTTVDAVEAETSVDMFSAVPPAIQRVIEARQDTGPQNLTLNLIAGDQQNASVGTAFGVPLTVEIRDGGGQAVSGNTVTFAALGSTADALLTSGDTQASVVTGNDGRASVHALAVGANGTYRVEASIAGVYTPVVFTLTNTAGAGFSVTLPLVVVP